MATLANPAAADAVSTRASLSGPAIGMLAAAMFMNYADRGSLSVVSTVLKGQLAIDDAGMGVLLSAFFWSYAAAQPFAGWLAQRYDVRRVLAIGVALWAGATMLCGLATGFLTLLGLRLLLGFGESVIFPCNACLFARNLADHERGRANAAMSLSMSLGPTAGTLVGGLILASYGWQAVFLCLGAVTLLWLVPWLLTPLGPRPDCSRPTGGPPAYAQILRQRALWGAALGQFCYSIPAYMLLTWLPLFLVQSQHLSLTSMALTGGFIFAMHGLTAVSSGMASDALIRRGASVTWVRKGFLLLGLAGGGLAMLGASLGNGWVVIVWLALNATFSGFANPMVFAIGQTLSGPSAGGRWMGFQNLVGNLAGIVAPMVTGFVVQATGSFTAAFALAAAISFVGVLCWALIVQRIEPVEWQRPSAG